MVEISEIEANTKIVNDAYASFAKGDVAGFFASFSDETELCEPGSLPYGGVYKGVEGATKVLMSIAAVWDEIEFEVIRIIASGNHVVTQGQFSAVAKQTGEKIKTPLIEIWEIIDGVTKSIEVFYQDTQKVNKTLGR